MFYCALIISQKARFKVPTRLIPSCGIYGEDFFQRKTPDSKPYRHTENKINGRWFFHFKFNVKEFKAFVGSGNLSPTDVIMVTQESELHRVIKG